MSLGVVVPGRVPDLPPDRKAQIHMEALHARTRGCRRCLLAGHRRHQVFGAGNPAAPIMVVGGNVTLADDREGTVLGGAGGTLFTRALSWLGLVPARDVWATHVVQCAVPLEDEKRRDPTAEELAACTPVLRHQLEIVRPAILVLHGRLASQVVLGDPRPLSKYVGAWRTFGGACLALSTHAPQGIVRGERTSLQREYAQHLAGMAERLDCVGRLWRPDAACFAAGWTFKQQGAAA